MPSKPNLILADVDEYVLSESVYSVPVVPTSEAKTSETKPKPSKSVSEDFSNEVKGSPDAPLVKELVSDDKLKKKIVFPIVSKIEFVRPKQQQKPVRKPVKYAKIYNSQCPRGNQRNWNNQKSQQLGSNFVMYNKACFVCGSFDHIQADCNCHQMERVNASNDEPRPYSDARKNDDEGVSKESRIDDQEKEKTDREKNSSLPKLFDERNIDSGIFSKSIPYATMLCMSQNSKFTTVD
nr:retrotransposon Orf1 [Tanacetum cinerariifolium]